MSHADSAPAGAVPPTPEAAGSVQAQHDLRGVLRHVEFRRLWTALSLSSLGDWLGLLATTSLAQELVSGYSAKLYALAGVLVVRLLPSVVLGPIAGAVADRFDRRWTMVGADVLRFALFVSIPLVSSLAWLFVASFLVECASLFWIPAKEASVPNLVPRQRLEAANQLSLVTTYGSAAVASVVFALLAKLTLAVASDTGLGANHVDIALYFDAVTFLFSAATIARLRTISSPRPDSGPDRPPLVRSIVDGWRFIGTERWLRGLLVGILGATAAGGTVIGLGRPFAVLDLQGGNAAYGVLFGTLFVGLAGGMFAGPRLLQGLPRRRLMGLAIVAAGVSLVLDALMPNLALAIVFTMLVGAFAGITWVIGITLVGLEVGDDLRGRTFASLYTLMRLVLLAAVAAGPLLAGGIGHHDLVPGGAIRTDGVTLVLLAGGVLAVVVGVVAYRMMDDHPGRSLWAQLRRPHGSRLPAVVAAPPVTGVLVALEGGEGAGKSTQAALLVEWLRDRGHRDVVLTREPGATALGARLREVLLSPDSGGLRPRAEVLLYAADRAQHVAEVLVPALSRGAIVVTDRYVDSSLAYQGAGRALPAGEVTAISRWATGGLAPTLTVLLDVDPTAGLRRAGGAPDRMEAEPAEFHRRVRDRFLALAAAEPDRYLVLDAALPADEVARRIRDRLAPLLPAAPALGAAADPADPVSPVSVADR